MDILAAVPGSDPDEVRRLIREVCGKWAGPNGRAKSRQHVVEEVIRLLRGSNGASQAEKPGETILVGKPTKSARDDAARFATLRKRMASARTTWSPAISVAANKRPAQAGHHPKGKRKRNHELQESPVKPDCNPSDLWVLTCRGGPGWNPGGRGDRGTEGADKNHRASRRNRAHALHVTGARYRVTYLGETLIRVPAIPSFEAAVHLLAKGIRGDAGDLQPRRLGASHRGVDIENGAKLTTVENAKEGPRWAPYRPHPRSPKPGRCRIAFPGRPSHEPAAFDGSRLPWCARPRSELSLR